MEVTYKHEELSCGGDYSGKPWETYADRLGGQVGLKGRDYFKAMNEYFPENYRRRMYR